MAKAGDSNISRTIVKAMGVFGSIQVFNILCSVIRTKLVALWIGPAGMGLFAIFNSAVDMIVNLNFFSCHNLFGKFKICHIRSPHRTINRKKA